MTGQVNDIPIEKQKTMRGRPSRDEPIFPRDTLRDSLEIAQSIEDNNAGRAYDRIDLAKSIGHSPSSSAFRRLIISSGRYNLTDGGYKADKISLTDVGRSIVSSTDDEIIKKALRQALLHPELFSKIYNYYDKKKIPRDELFKNSLKNEFGIASEDVDDCHRILIQNIMEYDLLNTIKGSQYLQLDKLSTQSIIASPEETDTEPLEDSIDEQILVPKKEQITKRVFVAHGKNTVPLEQLKNILIQFKVPFEVAIDEAHKGRPISKKVMELMENCTSGIFIFTADEETTDSEGKTVLKPSDNVVFELGAATMQYKDKIVIFREDGVSFGSDFTDFGHITFQKDKLADRAFELMKELIALGFLQVTPT